MDFPVAPQIAKVIAEALERHDFGYHRLPLDPRLRDVFVARMRRRFGWEVEPSSVWGLVNVVQGLDAAVTLFSAPGQGVLLQTPIYAPFHEAVDGSGRRRVDSPLVPGAERYEIDFDHLESKVDAETRVFLLCNPHNPTGRVFDRTELERLAEVVLREDLIVVSDEIHADLIYDERRHLPFAGLSPEIARRTITVTSATKAFNIAGLPTALMVLGSPEIKQRFRELPPHLLAHGGLLGTEATIAAWTGSEAWLDEVTVYCAENRESVSGFLGERLPQIGMLEPEATYLAWLDCRELALPGGPWRFFLDRARVALSNGEDFGPPGRGHVRLNFATSKRILGEILERMADAVDRS